MQRVRKTPKTRGGHHVWGSADDARQRILEPSKSVHVELGDAVEDGVTVVQPQTHDEAGDGVGEILVDQTTDVARSTQMVAVCAHNADKVVIERQRLSVQSEAQNETLLNNL